MRSIFFSLLNASVSGLLSKIVEASAYYSFVMMTLDRGSFSSLREVRHAVCDVSGFDVTCSQVGTYLRHCFYSSNKGIPYHSGLFCACKRHTVVFIFSTLSLLVWYNKPNMGRNVLRA